MIELDPRDIFYTITGLALLALTLTPGLTRLWWVNVPAFYVAVGAALSFAGLPLLDPRAGDLAAMAIEHGTELIVIISLAGAGLAIDTRETWRNWQGAIRLLAVAMPLCILAMALLGHYWLGLSAAGAVLLAAALAPTDPVLARSVQVGPPGGEESELEVALTAEAGLNDGLAFPFIYLAIAMVGAGYAGGWPDWGWTWLGYDLIWRVAGGIAVGVACGFAISKINFSPLGDARVGVVNPMVVVLAATLAAYGIAESLDVYGFLAVFAAARAGRANTRGTEHEGYERFVHFGAEQLEAVLLVLLLLWFGMFVGAGALEGLIWQEVALAALLIFAIRPASGLLALVYFPCRELDRMKVSFFGIRGMGSIFYIAYAQNHADFAEIDTIWRIAAVVVVMSIVVHGFAANFVIDRGPAEGKPAKPPAEIDNPAPIRASDRGTSR